MPIKALIMPPLAGKRLSQAWLNKERAKFERARTRAGTDHCVEFFHDPSDPYSQLLNSVMADFAAKYQISCATHIIGPPSASAAPEREKLAAYAKMDAMRLAKKAGLKFEIKAPAPITGTAEADEKLSALGHYQGGMIYYGGEWYWGLDRLHYLEARLGELGLRRPEGGPQYIYTPPSVPEKSGNTGAELHWYLSFRSPYTAIVRERVKALAQAYGAQIKLRFVLPMVMRGLPVPKSKRQYIVLDTAREARRLDVPFGRICDPVGRPVELGYSLLPWARAQGRGYEYVQTWLECVWSEGVNAGSSRGIREIVDRAGLDWGEAKTLLGNEDWRAEEKANRAEMMARGIWGVPSFRVGDTITWGQDRLWVIENALQKSP